MTRPSPDGLEFLGAIATAEPRLWLMSCPSCVSGTVALVPEGESWRLAAEIGCSDGCNEPEIAWWHLWRLGDLPPPLPPDERQRRYAQGAARRVLAEIPDRPSPAHVRRAAYEVGRFAAAGLLDPEPLIEALDAAGQRAGINNMTVITALTAGRAAPARLPL